MRKRYLHNCYGESDAFWDQNWEGDGWMNVSTPPPVWPRLASRMMNYLRPEMLLLEGGCGDGRYVRYFTDHGVKTIGIDFARRTVRKINDHMPDLDVRVGDIRNIAFPDGHFDGYYSGGVIEHFEDGVAPQLAEAYRVLKDGGHLFVTVPHMNLSRHCAAVVFPTRTKLDLDGRRSCHTERLREFRVDPAPDDYHFHEYVFSTREMRTFLSQHRFRIVEEMCFSSSFGLCDIEGYRSLVGAGRKHRTIINRLFAIPVRCVRVIEDSPSLPGRAVSGIVGEAFGNLKLYVCRAEK